MTVSGKAGEEFILADLTQEQIERGEIFKDPQEEEPAFIGFPVEAEANAVQSGLEQLYGPGNVKVTGGPGDEAGTKPYIVEFIGGLRDRAVSLSSELTPGFFQGQVAVSETQLGRPDGEVIVTATNFGDARVNGTKARAVLADVLPSGLHAVGITGSRPTGIALNARTPLPCELATLTCEVSGDLAPFDQVEMRVPVVADPGATSGEVNEATVTGGGAEDAVIRRPVAISSAQPPFGVENYELAAEDEGGGFATQAGAHPFQLSTTLTVNQTAGAFPVALLKDADFKLPSGLIGNVTGFPQCTDVQFFTTANSRENHCPPQTAVGVAVVTVNEPRSGYDELTVPVFNLQPRVGEPARFGFFAVTANAPVSIDTALRTGDDYGVTVSVHNVTQTAAFLSSQVIFWGVPGDSRHDNARGWGCLFAARGESEHAPCETTTDDQPAPLLSLPTSCGGSLQTSVEADSWAEPGTIVSLTSQLNDQLDGCNRLQFQPSVSATPETQAASTATGLDVDVHVPQEAGRDAKGLVGSAVKDIEVEFPDGVVLNPAAADGLQSCSEGEFGYLAGQSAPPLSLHFTPGAERPFCPEPAKVGTATITTPLLSRPLRGSVYLAAQGANPFGALVAMYIIAEDPVSGSVVKLAGEVSLDPTTGRLNAKFRNNPQLPFEDADIHLFGGARAPLATPSHCGTYTTVANFVPWSGGASVASTANFAITTGPGGTPCPGVLPFAPRLAAGTTSPQGGAFTPLTTTVSRADGEQALQTVRVHTPPGLSGVLTGVPLCPAARAEAGTCDSASLIGHTVVSAGVGPTPVTVTGGHVFLTEGYKGAPFGLSIVAPAKAGPFDLGVVVVRAKVEVDPHTAELTVSTDQIPYILDGVPLNIRAVNVVIDRPGFIFNPTNCGALSVTATFEGFEGAVSAAGTPFRAANCATLTFAPKFQVSTSGRTSKAAGASLSVKLSFPRAPFGSQANVGFVRVALPKQLPSRLTTLQKACTAAVFDANPAACPVASNVGSAKVLTPLLPVPLVGPAYLVSHGGEAFPDLTIVLQGYGITIDLVGSTAIKHGITTSTFKTPPDVPFGSFELKLPQGKYSVLAANGNLCRSRLIMPTTFVGQNGRQIQQTTEIAVTGCAKKLTRKEQLARSLKACRHKTRRRLRCERQAKRRYGARKHAAG